MSGLAKNTTYYWRVRSFYQGHPTDYSPTSCFTVAPEAPTPQLVSPALFEENVPSTTTLRWRCAAGWQWFEVQVSSDPAFEEPNLMPWHQVGLPDTSCGVTGLSPNTTYYWRVRALNNADTGSWTYPRTDGYADNMHWFFTTAPAGMTIVAATGEISWTPAAEDAGTHTVIVSVSDGMLQDVDTFTVTVHASTGIMAPARKVESVLTPSGFAAAPNPADRNAAEVWFSFPVHERMNARLRIYDSGSELLFDREFSLQPAADGMAAIFGPWRLCDRNGRPVGRGSYLAVLSLTSIKTGAAAGIHRLMLGVE